MIFFYNENSSSVSIPSSRRCWRQRSCSKFFIRMSTVLLGEHFTNVEVLGVGEKALAMALAALVKASEGNSLRCGR